MLDDASNLGKVSRHRSNELGVLDVADRRKPEPRRFSHGRDFSSTGFWIAVIAVVVVWALFGPTLGGV